MPVGVGVPVKVGVLVGDGADVGDGVNVRVGVLDGVDVGVQVSVGEGVTVCVGSDVGSSPPQALILSARIRQMMTHVFLRLRSYPTNSVTPNNGTPAKARPPFF